MSQVGSDERSTQDRVVRLFQHTLDYEYLGNWHGYDNNSNIEAELLSAFLVKQGYNGALINKAIYELCKTANDQSRGLYYVNKAVYSLLRYGVKIKQDIGENTQTVWLIDWKNPLNNQFAIAEEVTVNGENDKRPDVVIYVNGIALGVLELKRSTTSVSAGIRQNLDNQKSLFIQSFFATMQLVMAGSDSEGLRYATIETKEKYYLTWKEESATFNLPENLLDRQLTQVCNKIRLLELIHDFMVFDAGIKKVCRHNQYFGVKAAQLSIRQRQGGIIWHTQGSGKSLTMIWLAKWIRENIANARVLIITDRTELDEQIEGIFLDVDEEIDRCRHGKDLLVKLNQNSPFFLCSLIHKFGNKEEDDITRYIADVTCHLSQDFSLKGDLYVFVDECHRTQSGKLHQAMKQILPNALFIGFTGTPLLKKDKKTSLEVFGNYIHTYKFDEAIKDKVILDLLYEARDIDQSISSPAKIDQWFAIKTQGLNDYAQAQLKKRWGNLRALYSSHSRLEKIVADILLDMARKDRLQNDRGNALLVSGSIYQACKFYELFQRHGFTKCAIITSYKPTPDKIKGEETGEGPTERLRQYTIYQQMLNGKSVEDFEEEVKAKFVKEPGQMKLLIVVDKLLTGFDAPPATYLYIDKTMQDHGLFQAICRVNRLHGDDKEYGYIIDYKDLFHSLKKSIHDYTSGAFEAYEQTDVQGLLTDRVATAKERLEQARETVKALCEPVAPPKDTSAYFRYFCGTDATNNDQLTQNAPKRVALYKNVAALIRAYANLANEMDKAGYSTEQREQIRDEVKYYEDVRKVVKLNSGDYIDLKLYEPAMRHLIDTYIRAEESEKISAFDDISLIQLLVEQGVTAVDALPNGIKSNKTAVAETIENNMRKVIIDEQPINPKYYEKMSILLDELIKQRREEALKYEEYLAKIVELSRQVKDPTAGNVYPRTLDTHAKRALYDNLDKNEQLAVKLDHAVRSTSKDDWRGNKIKRREVKNIVKEYVPEHEVDGIYELIKNQNEY